MERKYQVIALVVFLVVLWNLEKFPTFESATTVILKLNHNNDDHIGEEEEEMVLGQHERGKTDGVVVVPKKISSDKGSSSGNKAVDVLDELKNDDVKLVDADEHGVEMTRKYDGFELEPTEEDTTPDDDEHDEIEDLVASHVTAANVTREMLCHDLKDDKLFNKRLVGTCSYYLYQLEAWKDLAKGQSKVVAWQQRSGAGDRLAGLISAFHYAFTTGKKLDIKWLNLDAVFQPSCFMNMDSGADSLVTIDGVTDRWRPDKSDSATCIERSSCHVSRSVTDVCPNGELHLVDKLTTIRGCASSHRCRQMEKFLHEPSTTANMLGCALRFLFEPAMDFLNQEVDYFMDGEVHSTTLIELDRMLKKKYKTISIHYRTGDGSFTKSKYKNGLSDRNLGYTQGCVSKVTNYVAKRDEDPRPVKWLVFSDNENLKNYFRTNFPNETITLQAKPAHVSKSKSDDKRKQMREIFAEFWLLGRSDEFIANHGKYRMSSFSAMAYLYSLRSRFFAIRFKGKNCHLMEMVYQGNTSPMPSQCSYNPFMGSYSNFNLATHSWNFQQPKKRLEQVHLQYN